MSKNKVSRGTQRWPTLAQFPMPAKALVSIVILSMAIAMAGALGQIIVHDIIPTFFSPESAGHLDKSDRSDQHVSKESDLNSSGRWDLFSEESVEALTPKDKPLYQTEQFVWT